MDVVLELSASERDDDDDGEDSVDTIAVTNQHEDKHEHDDTAFAEEASRMEERERDGDDRQNTEDAVADLKIFVATWNMAAKDPFSASKGEYIGDDDAASKLSGLLPPGYDLYVLGTQEKVSKHLHQAVLARLHAAERTSGRRFVCLQRPDTTRKRARRWSRKPATRSSEDDDDNNNGSALTRSSRAPSDASNNSSHHSSLSGYLQSFALEASSSIPVLSSKSEDDGSPAAPTPAKSSSRPRHSLFASRSAAKEAPFATEVSGRGDGAFLSSKSTSLSLYCASDLVEVVEIVRSGTHKFSFASGSKGGVAVMLRVAGHSLTFMNCHLDANRPSVRRQQLSDLSANLATAMGVGVDASRPITTASDHVIWMGDFNYRIHTLDGASVLKQIAMGRHLEVHDRYDSMRDDLAMLPDLHLFQEPSKWPTFFPTYKKIPGRPPHVEPNGATDPAWPTRVYRVAFREPFYKGGKLKAACQAGATAFSTARRLGATASSRSSRSSVRWISICDAACWTTSTRANCGTTIAR
ncbi:hypothetical protein PINS_up022450 [Pythium insidiosum]|nr:hypothetical protein PINS_up022450 [Pythium insidiosum]